MIGIAAERTRCFFNDRAGAWDEGIGPATVSASARLIRSLGIGRGSAVLDVGCGTGLIIPWLMEAVGGGGRVTALDIAEEMLLVARGKFEMPNVEYIHGSIEETPFLDGSFDEIVCHNCFPHVADKGKAVREMLRVLKPGGRVAISHSEGRDSVNRLHRSIGGDTAGHILPGESGMRDIFSGAGYGSMSIREESETYLFQALKPREARRAGATHDK